MSGAAAPQGLVLGRFWTGRLVGPLVGGGLARKLAQRLVVVMSSARGEYDIAGLLQRKCCLLVGGSRKERGGDSGVRVCVRGWWAQVVVSSIVQQAGRQAGRAQASKQQASESAPGNGWLDRGNPLAGGTIACVCDEAAYVQVSVYFLTLCQDTFRSLYRLLSQSLDLPALSHTPHYSLAPNHPTHGA